MSEELPVVGFFLAEKHCAAKRDGRSHNGRYCRGGETHTLKQSDIHGMFVGNELFEGSGRRRAQGVS
jgi:hypothetical protein